MATGIISIGTFLLGPCSPRAAPFTMAMTV
jgi:hypothetical protein